MKKFMITLILGLIIVSGCNPPKQVMVQQQNIRPTPEGDGLVFWTTSIPHQLKVGDPWSFYNSMEIKLETTVSHLGESWVDGGLKQVDSLKDLVRLVPVLTPGAIVPDGIKKDAQGNIISLRVKFSLQSTTYTFDFKVDGGYATLDKSKQGLIMFKGKPYYVNVKTDDVCKLKVKYSFERIYDKDVEAAEGVAPTTTPTK